MSASMPTETTAQELLARLIADLEALQAQARRAQVARRSLLQQFLSLQQRYQQQLLPTLMALPTAETLVTYHTEINRALRLLGMDVTFLQSARNPPTVQQRQAQMGQRLQQLLDFCHGLQQALAASDAEAQE